MTLDEAVNDLVAHGMTEAEAKRKLIEGMRSGAIKATGIVQRQGPQGELITTGRRQPLNFKCGS